jgi:hypothetical protein
MRRLLTTALGNLAAAAYRQYAFDQAIIENGLILTIQAGSGIEGLNPASTVFRYG